MNKSTNQSNSDITSGSNVSFWIDSTSIISYSKPDQDIQTEVLIIGGGIAGLTTAYKLLKAGKKIVLVEDGFIGSGETGRANRRSGGERLRVSAADSERTRARQRSLHGVRRGQDPKPYVYLVASHQGSAGLPARESNPRGQSARLGRFGERLDDGVQ